MDYEAFTADLKVNVEYISKFRGKGVIAKQDFEPGDLLWEEKPLVSHAMARADADQVLSLMTAGLRQLLPLLP